MRKFLTALVLIPLGLIFVVFAVANRHLVTVSFDPFNSTDPSVGVTLPLFVVIIAVAIIGRGGGRLRDLVPAAPLAARGAPARGRCPAGAGATGRSARRRRGLARAIRSAFLPPHAGRRLWVRRARQAGRDVVEPGPIASLFRLPSLPEPVP